MLNDLQLKQPLGPRKPRLTRTGVLAAALLLAGVAIALVAGLGIFRQSRSPAGKIPTAVSSAAPNEPAAAAVARGDEAFDREDYAGAILAYTDAITLNPKFAEAYNNRGLAHYRLNDPTAALADYNSALSLRPDYANALTNRAIVFFDQGDYAAVIADTSRAIELDPNADSAYVFRGNAYMRLGDYVRALADTLKAQSIRMQRRNEGL